MARSTVRKTTNSVRKVSPIRATVGAKSTARKSTSTASRTASGRKKTIAAQPAKKAVAKKVTPAVDALASEVDMDAIASSGRQIKALPKSTRGGSGSANPFIPQLEKSIEKDTALQLPPVPNEQVKTLLLAIRRAARTMGIGVNIRTTSEGDTTVIAYKAKP